jgi:predicted RND superfamily exporter protein
VAGQSFIEERTVVLLAASTFSGVMLSLVIAFVALVMATDNIAIASLAIINIGGVVLCTIALIVSFGWSLDVIESICITILVGVSVDFIVHFAHAYSESESRKRSDKARVAWTHLGISVVFGGTTTLLATLPLFFTVFEFFSKFGTFLFCAILLALYFSHFPFLVMLTMVGPESKQYKPTFWFGKLRKKWEERKANKADQA